MIINQEFPFPHCESCPECVLSVSEEQTIFAADGIVTRQLCISCKNESLCRRLENVKQKQDLEGKNR